MFDVDFLLQIIGTFFEICMKSVELETSFDHFLDFSCEMWIRVISKINTPNSHAWIPLVFLTVLKILETHKMAPIGSICRSEFSKLKISVLFHKNLLKHLPIPTETFFRQKYRFQPKTIYLKAI